MPSVMRNAKEKLGAGSYLSVGVEVPPRHGANFSMRYKSVTGLTAGWALLRARMKSPRRRVNDIGELVVFSEDGNRKIVVGGFLRISGGRLSKYLGSGSVLRTGEGKSKRERHISATWKAVHGDQLTRKGR